MIILVVKLPEEALLIEDREFFRTSLMSQAFQQKF